MHVLVTGGVLAPTVSGQWDACVLDDEDHAQLFVPVGSAHGFCVLSDVAEVLYKVSTVYDPTTECGIRWNDPTIGIEWPIRDPLLSDRDNQTETFADFTRRTRG